MVYEAADKLGNFFSSRRERGIPNLPTLSVTLTNGLIPRDSLDRKMETNLSDEEHLLVRKDDIVYNTMRMWQGASGLADRDGLLSPAYVVLAPKKGIDPLYASYLFKSSRFIYLFWAYSYGLTSDRLRLYFNDFKSIPVNIPPLPEQIKTGNILSTWDKAIEKLEALITTKQKRKKALMQQLLTGKMRFAGFDGTWKETALSHIANVTMGSSPKSVAYNENSVGLPLIQGNADIKNRFSAPRIHTTEITKECKPEDILMSVRAPVGAIAKSIHHACIGRGICSITARNGVDQQFLYHWFLAFEPKWASLSQGSTFESVNSADIKSLAIYMPIEEMEQQKIAAVLSAADNEITTHQTQLAALKQQKTGLMQQLLTGKKRVKVNQVAA
jgi:type I restriction enzyme S subunit